MPGRGAVHAALQETAQRARAESRSFRLDWASHAFQTWLRLGLGALEFSQPRFFPPHKFKRSHRIFDNLLGAEEVRFYDGIKKQKLEVRFNVLALTFSKVILSVCVCACVCVKTVSKTQNNSREVKSHTLKKEI